MISLTLVRIFWLELSVCCFASVFIDEGVWALSSSSSLLACGKTSAAGGWRCVDVMCLSVMGLASLIWPDRSVMSLRSVRSPVRPVWSPKVISLLVSFYFTSEAEGASEDTSSRFSISLADANLLFLLSRSSGNLIIPNWLNLRTMFFLQNL